MAADKKLATGALASVFDKFVSLCWVKNRCDTKPQPELVSIKALIAQFSSPKMDRGTLTAAEYAAADDKIKHDEKDGEAFIPAVFSKPNTRRQDDVHEVTAFVFDFDGGVTRAEFEQKLKPFGYFAFTTYSHSVMVERWRLVLFYAFPASPSDHRQVYSYFARTFEGRLDDRAKTLNQLWYSPACPPDAGALFCSFVNEAPLLVPSDIVALERNRDQASAVGAKSLSPAGTHHSTLVVAQQAGQNSPMLGSNSDEFANVTDALRHICPDDRGVWIKMGMALKQAKPCDAYRTVWLQWSKASKKYDEDAAISAWQSFKGKADGVTLGTIFYLARQAGWTPTSIADDNAASVEELNADHFVARENGKTCVFREKHDETAGRKYLERMMPKDVVDFYRNRKITMGKKQVGLGAYWLDAEDRRQYKDVVFAPNQDVPGSYNLWHGFSVEPRRGNWSKMRNHIKKVICAGDKDLNQYVLGWMASAVQRPDCPGEVALVLQGSRGAGKGSFVHPFGRLFGQHYLQVTQARQLVGNFNSHLHDCLVLFADEAFWAGDRQGENVLKALITEPTIMIEPKGINAYSIPNYLHIIIASNSDWVIPAGERERRYCVLKVSDIHAQDTGYFAALRDEMENGGLGAMLFDLQKMDLSKFDVRKAPYTTGLKEQMLHTMSHEKRWWYEELQSGEMWTQSPAFDMRTINDVGVPPNSVARSVLQQRFVEACRGLHASRGNATELGMLLPKLLPEGWPKELRTPMTAPNVGRRYYLLPSLTVAREYFEQVTGLVGVFEDEAQGEN